MSTIKFDQYSNTPNGIVSREKVFVRIKCGLKDTKNKEEDNKAPQNNFKQKDYNKLPLKRLKSNKADLKI